MKRFILSTALLLVCTAGVRAQWTDDPATNNRVTPSNVGFYDPVMLTNDAGVNYFFYIVPTTLPNGNDAFQYRMQILNAQGERVYGAAGKVVSHERNITWTKYNDYIALDRDGNCIVSSYDLRDSAPDAYDFNFYIYKIAPTGEELWGPVALNNGQPNANTLGLKMCGTDDGGSAFVYTTANATGTHRITQLERLDSDGQPLWQQPVAIEPEHTTSRPFVLSNGQNGVLVVYQDGDGQFVARSFNAEGNDEWGHSVVVYNGSYSSDKVYPCLNMQSGPDGGVVLAVMDAGYVGRIVSLTRSGEHAFAEAEQGTPVPSSNYLSTVPSVCCDGNNYYVAYNNIGGDYYHGYEYGVHVQKFSSTGERLWQDDGVVALPTQGGQQVANPTVRLASEGRVAVFFQHMASTAHNDPVSTYIILFDADGNALMEPQNFTTSTYVKNDLMVSPIVGGNHYIVSWTEKRSTSTSACIYAQYVNLDGSTTNGIEQVTHHGDAQGQERIYDLQGRQLSRGSAHGLHIVRSNGTTRKIIE